MKKMARFIVDVKQEMAKVRWPNKKEMLTYSIATLTFIIVFGVFFAGLDFILSGIKLVVK